MVLARVALLVFVRSPLTPTMSLPAKDTHDTVAVSLLSKKQRRSATRVRTRLRTTHLPR